MRVRAAALAPPRRTCHPTGSAAPPTERARETRGVPLPARAQAFPTKDLASDVLAAWNMPQGFGVGPMTLYIALET